jgi:hypothetical protein
MMPDFFIKILSLFNSQPDINRMGFLTSFFKVGPESFTDVEEVELDIIRNGEEIAPVVTNLSTGAVAIVEDVFTNKKVPFPVYALEAPVGIDQLMARQPGEDAYQDKIDWYGKLARILVRRFSQMTAMIRRSIEVQAAQILQTGTLDLTDEDGKPAWRFNFNPNPEHFRILATPWSSPNADIAGDIRSLSDTLRNHGQVDIKNLVMDDYSLEDFLNNERIQRDLKMDGLRLGALNPRIVGKGAKHYGHIHIGSNMYDIWVYSATYNPFGSTETKKYLGDHKVLFLPAWEDVDFRRIFGGVPKGPLDGIFDQVIGGQKITIEGEYDFRTRVYYDVKPNVYTGEVKSRPICMPVSIDRFGCLTTG